jgi:hypothetical protein
VSLDDHPDTRVLAESALFSPSEEEEEEEEDWLNEYDPHAVFMSSYYELGDILAEYGKGGGGALPHSGELINRMVFTQQISALETFLGDTIIKATMADNVILNRLLCGEKDLKGMSVTLSAIVKDREIVQTTVIRHLQALLFHKLAKVAAIYQIAFLFDIWPDKETKVALHRAIGQRHDCVHRNGKTKDGQELDFSTDYVKETLDTMVKFVDHISAKLAHAVAKPQ